MAIRCSGGFTNSVIIRGGLIPAITVCNSPRLNGSSGLNVNSSSEVIIIETGGGGSTDAGDLTSGTLPDARLSSNIPKKDAVNAFTNTNNITAPAAGSVPLTVKGTTSQSANLLEVKNVSDTVVASVSPAGLITGNGSGLSSLFVQSPVALTIIADEVTPNVSNGLVFTVDAENDFTINLPTNGQANQTITVYVNNTGVSDISVALHEDFLILDYTAGVLPSGSLGYFSATLFSGDWVIHDYGIAV